LTFDSPGGVWVIRHKIFFNVVIIFSTIGKEEICQARKVFPAVVVVAVHFLDLCCPHLPLKVGYQQPPKRHITWHHHRQANTAHPHVKWSQYRHQPTPQRWQVR
jgi:hypothetical protein